MRSGRRACHAEAWRRRVARGQTISSWHSEGLREQAAGQGNQQKETKVRKFFSNQLTVFAFFVAFCKSFSSCTQAGTGVPRGYSESLREQAAASTEDLPASKLKFVS